MPHRGRGHFYCGLTAIFAVVFRTSEKIWRIIKTFIPSKDHEIKNNNNGFLIGSLLQLINPKIIIYGITAMASYVLVYYKELPAWVFFAFLLAIIGFSGTLCWALFGSLFSILFDKHRKTLNLIMAILLLYCAVSLFL
jgi:threonine/homoserine/homoserine lactone efflux protein